MYQTSRKDANDNKTIIIWTEGGKKIGMGHVCRCLVIAKELRKNGTDILFLINNDPAVIDRINREGFRYEVASLSEVDLVNIVNKTPEAVLIDTKKPIAHLIKQIKQEQPVKPKIILMDNTTSARLEADMVIYPAAIFENNLNWDGFRGKVFGGADYVPVARSYIRARRKAKLLQLKSPYQVLVTMGGSDPNNLTYKIVSSLLEISELINIKVIIGPAFSPDALLDRIEKQKFPNVEFIRNEEDLSSIMCESHVALTALGTTLYELAAVGVPAIIISNYEEDNQDIDSYKKLGVHLPLGYYGLVQPEMIRNAIKSLLFNQEYWEMMRNEGWKIIDGKGTERIARLLFNLAVTDSKR